jgi:RNA polymerase sigma-70 factor (ECF subfamily)
VPETSILKSVAEGEPGAVQACIDRYGGLVWSLSRRLAGNTADAEDAVQDIFLDVWRSAGRFDPALASESTFIAMIARRRLIDRRRRAGRRLDGEGASPVLEDAAAARPDGTAEALDLSEDARAANNALEQLRPEQQRVIRLSIYHGLSHEKIAEATGLPLGTVKTHVRRGLMRVREILAGRGIGVNPREGVTR